MESTSVKNRTTCLDCQGLIVISQRKYFFNMKVDVLTEILLDVPVKDVADYAGNPTNAPEWYVNIKSVEWKTPLPIQEGSQVAFVAKFLGKRLAYTYEVTEWTPGEKLVMSTANGPFPMETTYTWEALGANKTKMTLRNQGAPSGFSKIFAPIMTSSMRKANEKDLKNLKRILEKAQ